MINPSLSFVQHGNTLLSSSTAMEKFSLLMGNHLETEIIVGCFLIGWINALYLDEKLQALVAWNWHLMA